MPLFAFEGRAPRVDPTAFVAPTATLIGDVTVEAGASVWFNAVLRGDYGPIVVREGANVQDGSVLHAPPGIPVDIGPGATVAHLCVIHGVHVGPGGADREPRHGAGRCGDRRAQPGRRRIPWCWPAPRSRPGCWRSGAGADEGPDRRNRRRDVGQGRTRRPTATWPSGIWPGWSRSRLCACWPPRAPSPSTRAGRPSCPSSLTL